jgi:tRNA dimethylallyltransferase
VSVYNETGKALSDWQAKTRPIIPKRFCRRAVLLPERQSLYDQINTRFDAMIENGGLAEAKTVFAKGYDSTLPIMKAIGLQQFFPYLRGEVELSESVELAKRDTRRFAKRQFTWFRGQAADWTQITNNAQKRAFETKVSSKMV